MPAIKVLKYKHFFFVKFWFALVKFQKYDII